MKMKKFEKCTASVVVLSALMLTAITGIWFPVKSTIVMATILILAIIYQRKEKKRKKEQREFYNIPVIIVGFIMAKIFPQIFEWNIFVFSFLIIWSAIFSAEYFFFRKEKQDNMIILVNIALLSYPILGIYHYWETQMVWVFFGFFIGSQILLFIFLIEEEEDNFDNKIGYITIISGIELMLCVLSTIIQYWSKIIQFFVLIYPIIIGAAVCLSLVILIIKQRKRRKGEKEEKKKILLKQEEEERQEIERKKQEIERERKAERYLEEQRKILEETVVNWDYVSEYFNWKEIPIEIFEKKIIFFSFSKEKKEIRFNRYAIYHLGSSLSHSFEKEIDDEKIKIIEKAFRKMKQQIEENKNFKGYIPLKENFDKQTENLQLFCARR